MVICATSNHAVKTSNGNVEIKVPKIRDGLQRQYNILQQFFAITLPEAYKNRKRSTAMPVLARHTSGDFR